MPGLTRSSYIDPDALDYADWLSDREGGLADQPHWLELKPLDAGEPMPVREVTAQHGDSISKILGTNDPSAIGAFARTNGLTPGDSTIYSGRSYLLPMDSDAGADRGEGLLMIRGDNNRLAQIRALREQELAKSRASTAPPSPASSESAYAPEVGGRFAELNRNPYAILLAGSASDYLGEQVGMAREARDTVSGTLDAVGFALPLADPISDFRKHGFEGSTIGRTISGATRAADAALPYVQHPSMISPAIARKAHQWNVELNPLVSPAAPTATGEAVRRFPIASNRGRLEFDVATSAAGGAEFRTVNGLNKVRAALEGPAMAAKYGPASRAALAEPYVHGMASHYISRAFGKKHGIPKWIIDSPFNVSKPPGLTKGEMYMYHSMYDPKFEGASLPNGLDRKGWRFKDFDVDRFGPTERLIYGAPGALKGTIGGLLGGIGGLSRYGLEAEPSLQ